MSEFSFHFDQDLHEHFEHPVDAEKAIEELLANLPLGGVERAKSLGKIGACLRILGKLHEAETHLLKAIWLLKGNSAPLTLILTEEIRLAHVYQWQKNFSKSNEMFEKILQKCSTNEELVDLLDFVLQHAGKNYFDQNRYQDALAAFEKALEIRLSRSSSPELIESSRKAVEVTRQRLKNL